MTIFCGLTISVMSKSFSASMNNNLTTNGDSDSPEPVEKKKTRKQAREDAEAASDYLGLIRCSPKTLRSISCLGVHVDHVGPGKVAKGVFQIGLDETLDQLKEAKEKVEEFDKREAAGEVLTPEEQDWRIQWIRVRGDAIGHLRGLGSEIVRSKTQTVERTHSKTGVQSFPANTPIPPMTVTETVVVKQSESE